MRVQVSSFLPHCCFFPFPDVSPIFQKELSYFWKLEMSTFPSSLLGQMKILAIFVEKWFQIFCVQIWNFFGKKNPHFLNHFVPKSHLFGFFLLKKWRFKIRGFLEPEATPKMEAWARYKRRVRTKHIPALKSATHFDGISKKIKKGAIMVEVEPPPPPLPPEVAVGSKCIHPCFSPGWTSQPAASSWLADRSLYGKARLD